MSFRKQNGTITKTNTLQLMKSFYKSYSPSKLPIKLNPSKCQYYRPKTNQAAKLTQFLLKSNYSRNSPRQNHSKINTSSLNNNNRFSQDKRCYFKNSYSVSNPFFAPVKKTLPKLEIKRGENQMKRKMTEPINNKGYENQYYRYLKGEESIKGPVQNRIQLKIIKDKIQNGKAIKKQKMDKIRYNYILNNQYKQHIDHQQEHIGQKMKTEAFTTTKLNIFPNQY